MLYDKPDSVEVPIGPSLNFMALWNPLDESMDFCVAEFTVERLPLKNAIHEQVLYDASAV